LFVPRPASTSPAMRRWIPFVKSHPRVSVVRLQGAIGMAGRSSLSDRSLATVLEKAFKSKPDAVALEINSPGGSPVQSSLIGARIRRLAEETEIPVLAFVEDVAASGGYWIASAADEIWSDPSSILGSIGVISAGFGAPVFLQRQGIERRVYTAGTSKSMLDPFKPENEEDVARLHRLLAQLHETFIAQVKDRRGEKLTDNPDLFTGEVWIGASAVEQGLADGVGHLVPVLKARFGDKVRLKRFEQRKPLFPRFGAQAVQGALGEIEERADFARFGLS
jgi:signal peptide peptidase SppA